jgi:hypothetical protein
VPGAAGRPGEGSSAAPRRPLTGVQPRPSAAWGQEGFGPAGLDHRTERDYWVEVRRTLVALNIMAFSPPERQLIRGIRQSLIDFPVVAIILAIIAA